MCASLLPHQDFLLPEQVCSAHSTIGPSGPGLYHLRSFQPGRAWLITPFLSLSCYISSSSYLHYLKTNIQAYLPLPKLCLSQSLLWELRSSHLTPNLSRFLCSLNMISSNKIVRTESWCQFFHFNERLWYKRMKVAMEVVGENPICSWSANPTTLAIHWYKNRELWLLLRAVFLNQQLTWQNKKLTDKF